MVHSVRAHAWQQSTWWLPLWINHLLSYQNILCMQTQHWGSKMVCLRATTNQTLNISKPTGVLLIKFVLLAANVVLYWCWWLRESKRIDGLVLSCEGATTLLRRPCCLLATLQHRQTPFSFSNNYGMKQNTAVHGSLRIRTEEFHDST